MKTRAEIETQIDLSYDHDRSLWRGMSYEDGVANALRWVLEDDDSAPMDEE